MINWRDERKHLVSGGKTVASHSWHLTFYQISDFGLSKWMEQSTRMQYIERSALRGTLSYIPPEVFLESNKTPRPSYDVYR